MIILKIYSIFIVILMLGISLKSKSISDSQSLIAVIMFAPILIYLLFGGVDW